MKYLLLTILVLWLVKKLFQLLNLMLEHSRVVVVPTREAGNVEAWVYNKAGGSDPAYFYISDAHRLSGQQVLQRVNRFFEGDARVNMVIVDGQAYGN